DAGAGDGGRVVGAVDGDGDGARRAVDAGDVEGLGDRIADVEAVEGAVGGEGPGAGGVDGEGADGAHRGAGRESVGRVVHVGAGEGARGGERGVGLDQGDAGAGDGGRVVCAVDGDGDGARRAVDAGDVEGLGDRSADVEA